VRAERAIPGSTPAVALGLLVAAAGLTGPASLPGQSIQPEAIEPFLPLAHAVQGQWVEYAACDSRTLRYEIVKTGASTVTTRVIVHHHGKPLGQPALRQDPRQLDPLARAATAVGAARRQTRTTIEAAGRRWPVILNEDRWIDEQVRYLRRTWVSDQVPLFGTVRMELYGDDTLEAQFELVALGADR